MGQDGRTRLARQILRRERRQGNVHFPCSTDHEQDWQPYPRLIHALLYLLAILSSYSAECCTDYCCICTVYQVHAVICTDNWASSTTLNCYVLMPFILDVRLVDVPPGVTRDFSTVLVRCLPYFFSREGFSRSFPSSTVKSNFVYCWAFLRAYSELLICKVHQFKLGCIKNYAL